MNSSKESTSSCRHRNPAILASSKSYRMSCGPMCWSIGWGKSTLRRDSSCLPITGCSRMSASQIHTTDPDGYYEGAPALAIEVASDSNTAAQLDLKIEQYFSHGSDEVWIVYPQT